MNIIEHKIGEWKAFTVENNNGMAVTLCTRGAGIASIRIPDREGVTREIVKQHANGYGGGHNGLTTGRTAGRISGATFTIDGRTAFLEKNNHGVDNLHGGASGLHIRVFDAKVEKSAAYTDVVFTLFSPDGEGGYFGGADITVTYRVYENANRLDMSYDVTPDCKTLINITNHAYFNTSGDFRERVTEQELFINASRVGVLGERSLTVGIVGVTPPFDFRTPHKIGEYINDPAVQLYAGGYDHPFFLDERGLDNLACSLYSKTSGIYMTVATTYPCAVVYTDNGNDNKSVCFECQYHPDGVHVCPNDCGICSPDKPYHEVVRYEFSIR